MFWTIEPEKRLPIECPFCGAENADTAEFCDLCLASMGFDGGLAADGGETEGFLTRYPSSFDRQTPGHRESQPGEARPEAPPVDIGEYGVRSGHSYEEGLVPPAQPGRDHPPRRVVQVPAPGAHGGALTEGERWFDWRSAIRVCAAFAGLAALVSMGLELSMSFIGDGLSSQDRLTGSTVLMLSSFLIPVAIAGYGAGYRLGGNGWLFGLISVGTWAFALRPLYYAALGWMLAERFSFPEILDKYNLAFIFLLYLPMGALCGRLGEMRAAR